MLIKRKDYRKKMSRRFNEKIGRRRKGVRWKEFKLVESSLKKRREDGRCSRDSHVVTFLLRLLLLTYFLLLDERQSALIAIPLLFSFLVLSPDSYRLFYTRSYVQRPSATLPPSLAPSFRRRRRRGP